MILRIKGDDESVVWTARRKYLSFATNATYHGKTKFAISFNQALSLCIVNLLRHAEVEYCLKHVWKTESRRNRNVVPFLVDSIVTKNDVTTKAEEETQMMQRLPTAAASDAVAAVFARRRRAMTAAAQEQMQCHGKRY